MMKGFKVQGSKFNVVLLTAILSLCALTATARAQTPPKLTVTWTDNSGKNPAVNDQESGFRVERNLNGGPFTLLPGDSPIVGVTTGADVQSYIDTTVMADNNVDNKYCYRVQAVNSAGSSGWATTATPGVTDCGIIPKRVLVIPADPSGQLVQ